MTEIDRAYLAGLFDGEGCIHIWKSATMKHKYQLVVTLANDHRKVIYDAHDQFGGMVQTSVSVNHNNYCLRLGSLKASGFLAYVLPYLRIKKEQADLAIQFQTHMSQRYPITDQIIEYRQSSRKQMFALKKSYKDTQAVI